MVESAQRQAADLKQWEKRLAQATQRAQQRRRAGRFILATNVLPSPELNTDPPEPDSIVLSADDILIEYKA